VQIRKEYHQQFRVHHRLLHLIFYQFDNHQPNGGRFCQKLINLDSRLLYKLLGLLLFIKLLILILGLIKRRIVFNRQILSCFNLFLIQKKDNILNKSVVQNNLMRLPFRFYILSKTHFLVNKINLKITKALQFIYSKSKIPYYR
jgi:hypothetical protein